MRHRKTVRLVLLSAVATWLGGCGADSATEDRNSISVGILGASWTDRLSNAVQRDLDAEGVTASYVAGGATEWLPRLLASREQRAPVDVVEVDNETTPDLLAAGLLLELDHDKIPNLRELDPSSYDEYRVAYWVVEQALLYNADKFAAAGIPAPTRYTDLADPRLAGRVIFPDIAHYASTFAVLALAYENGGDEANPQPGFDVLARVRPHSYALSSATVIQLFQSGDAWASPFAAHVTVRLSDAGLNVVATHPPVQGHPMIAHGYLAIPKNGRNPEAAHKFINAAIGAAVQKRLFDDTAILPANSLALQRVAADGSRTGNIRAVSAPAIIGAGWAPDFARIDRRDFVQRWQRTVDAQSH